MINYQHLADSINYYSKKKYQIIEAPWWVTKEIAEITKPSDSKNDYFIPENNKVLVASAEQSFLALANQGLLPKGKFQATTPCFRNEEIDLLHHKYFIKNELIDTENVTIKELNKMIKCCVIFFSQYIDKKRLKIIKTSAYKATINYDIVAIVNGEELELGSYGIRQCDILKWIYGTGCAEPRLTMIINRIKLEEGK